MLTAKAEIRRLGSLTPVGIRPSPTSTVQLRYLSADGIGHPAMKAMKTKERRVNPGKCPCQQSLSERLIITSTENAGFSLIIIMPLVAHSAQLALRGTSEHWPDIAFAAYERA